MFARWSLTRRLTYLVVAAMLGAAAFCVLILLAYFGQFSRLVPAPPLLLWLVIAAGISVCCVLAVWIIVRSCTPLGQLLQRVRIVQSEEFDVPVEVDAVNDFGELAHAIDQLRQRLLRRVGDAEKRLRAMRALTTIGVGLETTARPEQLAATAVEKVAEVLDLRACAAYLFDAERRVLEQTAQRGWSTAVAAMPQLQLDESFVQRALQFGEIVVLDLQELAHHEVADAEVLHGLAVPLVTDMGPAGLMLVATDVRRPIDPTLQDGLRLFGRQLAAALQNARILDEAQRRIEHIQGLLDISRQVARNLSAQEVLDTLLARVRDLVGVEHCAVYRLDEDGSWLRIANHVGLGSEFAAHVGFAPGQGAIGRAVRERSAIRVDDVTIDPHYGELTAYFRDAGVRSLCAVPLIGPTAVLGGIEIYSGRTAAFGEDEVRMLSIFANQAAIAIISAELHDQSRERLRELTALFDAMETLSATSDLDDILDVIIAKVRGLFDCSSCHISLVNDNTGRLRLVRSDGVEERRLTRHQDVDGIDPDRCWALKKGKTFRVDDAGTDFSCRELITRGETISYVCVPLTAGGKTFGVMHMGAKSPAGFTADQVRLFETLADQMAIATERAQLFQQIARLARTDSLTGIYNRRIFHERFSQELRRTQRTGTPLSLILFDIDHFKQHNDAYGHLSGDAVLCQITEICRRNLRAVDIFGRYGGEEFVIALPETDAEGARLVAEKLRRSVAQEDFEGHHGGPPVHCTISLGVATALDDGSSEEALIAAADHALYDAKEGGRNRVCLAEHLHLETEPL